MIGLGQVLITPFYLESNRSDAMRATWTATGRPCVGSRRNWDRVHPDHIGSMVLARAFVDAIGFDWTR